MKNSIIVDLSDNSLHAFDPDVGNSPRISIHTAEYESPIGKIVVGCYGEMVCCLSIGKTTIEPPFRNGLLSRLDIRPESTPFTRQVQQELTEYFTTGRKSFTFPILMMGTPFQLAVWRELCRVPYGSVVSYQELAKRANHPQAVRAVGTVMAANRIPILLPCHRVITATGKLGGFGCGIEVKQYLLNLEAGKNQL